MSIYHLHARLFEGPLSAPVRDELQTRETDDLAAVQVHAKELAARGFTVWIYDHGHHTEVPGASNYRTIFKYLPDGRVTSSLPPVPPPPT